MPKAGRKKFSEWKEAVNHYRNNPFSQEKQANYNNLFNLNKNSINMADTSMQKIADKTSDNYYTSAVQKLSDSYAKDYYAGLKGMHNEKPEKREVDYSKLYQTSDETGHSLILSAHPNQVVVSDAISTGGRVENLLEQHEVSEGVAFSMPTGNFTGRYAYVVNSLIKIATEADKKGLTKVSDTIDNVLAEFVKSN